MTSRRGDSVDQLVERIEFVRSQSPVLTDFQSAQSKWAEGDPLQAHHLVSDPGPQTPDLPVASLSKFQFQESALAPSLQFSGRMHLEEAVREMESVSQGLETGTVWDPRDLDPVDS